MLDILFSGTDVEKQIGFVGVEVSECIKQFNDIHTNTSLTDKVLSAKLLCAALLLGYDLKGGFDTLTIQTLLNDEKNAFIIKSNKKGEVKGYPDLCSDHFNDKESINADEMQSSYEINIIVRKQLHSLLKDGLLTVLIEGNDIKPISRTVKMITGEIARDFTWYLNEAEIPAAVGLSVLFNNDNEIEKACGFIVKLLPEASEESLSQLENNLYQLPELTDLMDMGLGIEQIFENYLLKGFSYHTDKSVQPIYKCNCSKKQLLSKIDNVENISNSPVTIQCSYCKQEYQLD